MKKIVLATFGLSFLLLVTGSINSCKRSDPPSPEGKTPSQASGNVHAPQAPKTQPKKSWSYDQTTDKMTGKVTRRACLDSADQLQFNFPNAGGTQGTICLQKGQSLEASFKIDKGQVMCGLEGCAVRIAVDGGTPFPFNGSESPNHDSKFIVFDSYPRMLAIAKKATQIKVEVRYYQEGSQTLTFEPSQPLDKNW
jgi:hypothetical protein